MKATNYHGTAMTLLDCFDEPVVKGGGYEDAGGNVWHITDAHAPHKAGAVGKVSARRWSAFYRQWLPEHELHVGALGMRWMYPA